MLGLDSAETTDVVVGRGNAKWTVGVIPWGKLVALREALAAAHRDQGKALAAYSAADEAGKADALAAFDEAHAAYLDACAEVVRWGVRRTPTPLLNGHPLVEETFAGASFKVLSPGVVDVLRRVRPIDVDTLETDGTIGTGQRELLDVLAGKVLEANTVDPADLLGFR